MPLNWIDWVIIAALLFEAYDGWKAGLISLGASFISFLIALWLAIVLNPFVSGFLTEKFGIAAAWSSVFGYLAVGIMAQMLIAGFLRLAEARMPQKLLQSKFNSLVGAILSVLNGIIIIAFFLLIITALPLRGTIKSDIRNSAIGGPILGLIEQYGGPIKNSINELGSAATRFITIDPTSTESITLDVAPQASDLSIDAAGEKHMLDLVNAERAKVGVPTLTVDAKLTDVAESHSRDMFLRRYFSHVTPEGTDPGQRLTAAGIIYSIMGENIGYAPDVDIAHRGLMNSPEHKKNILEPQFRNVGIGIISTKSFGLMVTQEFTN